MKSRIPLIVAVLLAMFALGFAGSRLVSSVPQSPPPAHAPLAPALASYLGTFEPGAPSDYSVVASFARTANRQPNLVGYFGSGSGVASQEQFWSAYGLAKAFWEMNLDIPAVIRLGGNSERERPDSNSDPVLAVRCSLA